MREETNFDALENFEDWIEDLEEADSHFCPVCHQHFIVHNDDGSCIMD